MTSHTARRASPETAASFDPIAALGGPLQESFMTAGEAYAKACKAWQEEMVRFIGERFEFAREVGESLTKCRTPSDFAEVQKNCIMATAQDCFEQANRLAQLTYKFLPSWLPPAVVADERKPRPTHDAA